MRILIVGAGPVGSYTAQLLKERGYHSVLLEEHTMLGKPVHCAGIVSREVLSLIEPFISTDAIKSRIDNFSINTPWEEPFSINKEGIAVVLNREKADLSLGKDLDVHLGERVSSIKGKNGTYTVSTEQGREYEADVLIGADGANSIVRKYFLENYVGMDIKNDISLDYYFGLQYQIKLDNSNLLINHNEIGVFFNSSIPFFIWIIPEKEHSFRIGVLANNGKQILTDFLREQEIEGEIEEIFAGKIPIGFIPTSSDSIALVGDAACQVKPLTGGGLSFGLQSARILADCIKEDKLEQYDSRWKKKFGQEIRFGMKARKIYENLDESQRKEIFKLFKKNSDFIENIVDYDRHSKLFREALRQPRILLDAGKVFLLYLEDLVSEFTK